MELVNTTQGQLSVFDYGNIASRYGDNVATELKGLQHQGDGILNNAKIDFGNVLRKGKALVSHGDFEKWVMSIWRLEPRRARDLMTVAEANSISAQCAVLFPDKLRPATAMATAILNAPEDKREELVGEIKEKREEKGKDLTEAEIKQLAKKYLDEQQAKINVLEQQKLNLQGTISELKSKEEHKDRVIADRNKEWAEYLANKARIEEEQVKLKKDKENLEEKQKKLDEEIKQQVVAQIKEKEAQLLADKTKLEEDTKALKTQQKDLDKEIKKEADVKAKILLQEKQAKLEKKEKEIEKKLNEAKNELEVAKQHRARLDGLNNWLDGLKRFNSKLDENSNVLLSTARNLAHFDVDDAIKLIDDKGTVNIVAEVEAFYEKADKLIEVIEQVKTNMERLNITPTISEATNLKVVELVN